MLGNPPPRFVRRHRAGLEYLPLHTTSDGELADQECRAVCACGWSSSASTSPTVIGSEHMDHVWQAWEASRQG